jgi:ribonuclease HI
MRTMGVGIIVKDNKGQVHAASSKTILSVWVPVEAKAMGALFAVEFSGDLSIQDIDIEGDSLQVIQAIFGSDVNWSSYGHITGDTRWVLNSLRSWTIGLWT